ARPVYLDGHATTPLDSRVLAAMLPYFTEQFGNAASRTHAYGWEAAAAVERAREQLAAGLGAQPEELVFTSGATEADNLAVKGVVEAARARGDHVVVSSIEHPAVLDPCLHLERLGFRVTRVPVGASGVVGPEDVARAVEAGTVLVSVMLANNEVGTIQPVREIAALVRARGVPVHTDAAQAVGKIPVDVRDLDVDLLSLSGHKLQGPKGVGALYVRRGGLASLVAQQDGGGHERGRRAGTLDVPAIVGLGCAVGLAVGEGAAEQKRLRALRDRLLAGLAREIEGLVVNGDLERRLPGSLNVSVPGLPADAIVGGLREIAISTGSACASASLEPSRVLRAMGLPDEVARGSLRFGLGRWTGEADVDLAIRAVAERVATLRASAGMS
ncbi:MAG: cysteine desulfurase, partial [Deltaproteobacteria bacterium]|nr:cysteine desulfurase [Deltaproteobacteria bacterium]